MGVYVLEDLRIGTMIEHREDVGIIKKIDMDFKVSRVMYCDVEWIMPKSERAFDHGEYFQIFEYELNLLDGNPDKIKILSR